MGEKLVEIEVFSGGGETFRRPEAGEPVGSGFAGGRD